VPHVGGPIQVGAPTVLINGAPAARVGDLVQEQAGQVSAIAAGAATVVIGGSGN